MDRVMKVCKITYSFHKPLVNKVFSTICGGNMFSKWKKILSGGFRGTLFIPNQITEAGKA